MNNSRAPYYRCRRRIQKNPLGIDVFTTHVMTHKVNKLITGSEAKVKESKKKKKRNKKTPGKYAGPNPKQTKPLVYTTLPFFLYGLKR